MHSQELRQRYLDFFERRGHALVPSSLLVPENDPTTLFTGSGMQPMLPYFLGEQHPAGRRVADSQKAFRTQDIEEVGDNRHTTFFEMLGNWSFGDYFKIDQITWMWEFLTRELGLDPERLFFTCFRGNSTLGIPRDTVAAEAWQRLYQEAGLSVTIVDFPERHGMQGGHIFYYDEKKNWWSRAGAPAQMPVGEPGGPDTEMFFDFRPDLGDRCIPDTPFSGEFCHVNCDCGRFMEIGNNVFMQYRKTEDGFAELAQKNVDFGGGLERLLAATNDIPDIFLLDFFDAGRTLLERLAATGYGQERRTTFAMRVILDHLRAALFLIGDGVLPDNKDQGYFVRRLIRRAVRYGGVLGIVQDFTAALAETFIPTYAAQYPTVERDRARILDTMAEEERKFRHTLINGLREFEKRARVGMLSGEDAFDLFATYGFPFEMTLELAAEKKLSVDKAAFKEALKAHQDLSRTASAGKFKGGLADHGAKVTAFHTATHLMLAALRRELGDGVHQAGSNITEERTRFDFTYPEKVPRETLDRVEAFVNEAIKANATVKTTVMDKAAARSAGVEGSFWEKYPDRVTVYQVEGPDGTLYSQELCGGPHVKETAEIAVYGRFRIVKEEASSAGVRRVKAVLEKSN